MKKCLLFFATLFLALMLSMAMLSAVAENNDPSEIVYYDSLEEIGAALRQQLKNRAETCSLGYSGEQTLTPEQIWNEALKHTGVPDEGDYLRSCLTLLVIPTEFDSVSDKPINGRLKENHQVNVETVIGDDGTEQSVYTFFGFQYRTTYEQEQAVSEMINVIRRSIRTDCFDNTVSDIISYMYSVKYIDNEYSHTAYGALFMGGAVCEGQSALFYRLALASGLNARIILGTVSNAESGEGHAWNCIKYPQTGDWYYVDPTSSLYLFSGQALYPGCSYVLFDDANEPGFRASHPISMTGYKMNIPFSFDEASGTLTILANGDLPDVFQRKMWILEDGDLRPWLDEYKDSIRHIVIPEGVTRIGAYLFEKLPNLESVSLPNSLLEIGDRAFNESYVSSGAEIQLPADLKTIGSYAFYGCGMLIESLPNSLTRIGSYAFYSCCIGNITLPENLHEIEEGVFYSSTVTHLEIPDGITSIGANAFSNSHLHEITFGENSQLSYIGPGAFSGTGLETIHLPVGICEIADDLFRGCFQLKTVTYAAPAIKSIGARAFMDDLSSNCEGSIDLHGVESIGENAFSPSHFVIDELPEELVSIGDGAFVVNKSGSVFIPINVRYIGKNNFLSATSITVDPGNPYFTAVDGVLYTKDMTELVCLPETKQGFCEIPEGVQIFRPGSYGRFGPAVLKIPSTLTEGLEEVVLLADFPPETIEVAESNPLYCSVDGVLFDKEITRLIKYPSTKEAVEYTVPNTVKSISRCAFMNTHFVSLTIPEGVTHIFEKAFYDTHVDEIRLPQTVETLGLRAFEYCHAQTISIGNNVRFLSNSLIRNCGELSTLYLGDGIRTLDYEAICLNNPSAVTIYYNGTRADWEKIEFYDPADKEMLEAATIIYNNPTINACTVSFDANGGTLEEVMLNRVFLQEYGTLPIPTREGYSFYGWFTAPVGGVPIDETTTVHVRKDHTLYAHWEDTVIMHGIEGEDENILWALHSDGEMTFYGYSEVPSNGHPDVCAFWNNRNDILHVTVSGDISGLGDSAFYGFFYAEGISFETEIGYIGEDAFYGWFQIEELVIPASVRSIGKGAFNNAQSLRSIVLPAGIEAIEDSTFASCYQLESIIIPEGVKRIGKDAFAQNEALKCITLPQSLETIGDFAFGGEWVPGSSTIAITIGRGPCTALESIVIPDNVNTVGSYAFAGCSALESVHIPESVTYMGSYAFGGCTALTTVTALNNYDLWWTYGIFAGCTSLAHAEVYHICDDMFLDCTALESIKVHNGEIPANAFFGCDRLKTVDLSGVTKIGEQAFMNCTSLDHLELHEGLSEIGRFAFMGCTSLQEVALPESVNTLSDYAFSGCAALETLRLYDGIEAIPYGVFDGCTALQTVYWHGTEEKKNALIIEEKNEAFIDANTVYVNDFIQIVVTLNAQGGILDEQSINVVWRSTYGELPAPISEGRRFAGWYTQAEGGEAVYASTSVVQKQDHTLYAHWTDVYATGSCGEDLTWQLWGDGELIIAGSGHMVCDEAPWSADKLYIRSITVMGAENIADNAFEACMNLRAITLDDALKSIGANAFKDDKSLRNIVLPNSVEVLGHDAFVNCSNLKTITFPSALKSIGNHCFVGCGSLELGDLVLPYGLESIGDHIFYDGNGPYGAFFDYSNFTSVSIPDTVTSIGRYAFAHTKIQRAILPSNLESIPEYLFWYCEQLETVNIPDGIKSIGEGAFWYCASLESAILPDSVESIGRRAFSDTGIVTLRLSANCPSLANEAFCGCFYLTDVVMPEGVTQIGSRTFEYCTSLEYIKLPSTLNSIDYWGFNSCSSLKVIVFQGNTYMKDHYSRYDNFGDVTATVYYPDQFDMEYPYWDADRMQDYGGSLTWQSWYTLGNDPFCEHSFSETQDERGLLSFTLCSCECGYSYRKDITYSEVIITLDANGGTLEEETFTINDRGQYGDLPVPEKDSFWEFDGWYFSIEESEQIRWWTPVENIQPHTLYAHWSWNGPKGECGSNLSWQILENGVLYISGSGRMIAQPQWRNEYAASITRVRVEGAENIASFAFSNLSLVTIIELSEGLTEIGSCAFSGCALLEQVTLPEGLLTIGNSAFDCCTSLKGIELPGTVTSIGSYTFNYCTALEECVLSSSLTHIPEKAFNNCTALSEIIIPESITEIGNEAFCSSGLTQIVLPESLEKIGQAAFYNCSALRSLTLTAGIAEIGANAFDCCISLSGIITLPDSLVAIGRGAFANCNNITLFMVTDDSAGYAYVSNEGFNYIVNKDFGDAFYTQIGIMTSGGSTAYLQLSMGDVTLEGSNLTSDSGRFWKFEKAEDSGYYIRSLYDGSYLSVDSDGTSLICSQAETEWAIVKGRNWSDYKIIQGSYEGKALTYVDGENGLRLVMAEQSVGDGQNWQISSTSIENYDYTDPYFIDPVEAQVEDGSLALIWRNAPGGFAKEYAIVIERILPHGDGEISYNEYSRTLVQYADIALQWDVNGRTNRYLVPIGSGLFRVKIEASNYFFTWCSDTSLEFRNLDDSRRMTLPAALRTVGANAFKNTAAEIIVLPDGIEVIGAYAFADSSNLSFVYVPASVTFIDQYAFNGSENAIAVLMDGVSDEVKTLLESMNVPYIFYAALNS